MGTHLKEITMYFTLRNDLKEHLFHYRIGSTVYVAPFEIAPEDWVLVKKARTDETLLRRGLHPANPDTAKMQTLQNFNEVVFRAEHVLEDAESWRELAQLHKGLIALGIAKSLQAYPYPNPLYHYISVTN